ncbi:MAG TPA: site-specific integrase [Candidatus Paceibacterota bacterium]|nr:site-specific integrase [Candidatus Paceibacterota bacterium]
MEKVLTHKRYSENSLVNVGNWKVSNKEKTSVKQYVQDYENGKITGNIGTNPKALIERLLGYQKIFLENINKDNPTKKDIELFVEYVLKDKICFEHYNQETKKRTKRPYALKSKKAIFDNASKYLKWKFPNKLELIEPLKIKIKTKKPDPESLTEQEIDKLRINAGDIENRTTISILYGAGCRAEEFYNIRFSDVELPKGNEMFVKLRLRNEFSKTEGRTISLYYKYCLEDLRELIELRKNEGCKPEEPIFKKRYKSQRDWLINLGKKTLNKRIYFHIFRSSCATVLSNRLNRQQLCIYFGWKFNSPMPDVYIKRDGVDMKDVDNTFKATEFEALKNQLEIEKQKRALKEEEYTDKMKKLQDSIGHITSLIDNYKEQLPQNQKVISVKK